MNAAAMNAAAKTDHHGRGTASSARRTMVALATAAGLASLAACSHIAPSVDIREPTSARSPQIALAKPANGAIWTDDARPLFEDRHARRVGDILTVNITEKLSATQKSESSVDRNNDAKIAMPTINKFPLAGLAGAGVSASSSNKFDGKGATTSDNVFTGAITVTVMDVLANGYLAVSGEKQIGINHDVQTVRLSGIVDPASILAGNVVSSTQVADARIEWRGRGQMDEAQRMSWLSRFFMTISPF